MELPKGYILIKESELAELLAAREELLSVKETLLTKISELEARLNQNSNNSSKPPSSDGYGKVIKNNREKSSRSPGAQIGHKGSGLSPYVTVDKEVTVRAEGKCQCGRDISQATKVNTDKVQVIDLPEKLFEVIEYHVESVRCQCGKIHKALFEYDKRVQYGNRIKAFFAYMNTAQQIPYERIQELTKEFLGLTVSDGLIESSIRTCSDNLENTMEQLKDQVLNAPVVHADETGIRIESNLAWIHNSSTKNHTVLVPHSKRGKEAMDDIGLLPDFTGTLVHDRWASYDKYQFGHALCGAHLLRDLKFLHEEKNKSWALELKIELQQANESKQNGDVSPELYETVRRRIEAIVNNAMATEQAEGKQDDKRRGRKKKGKALCMLNVFRDRLEDILRFLSEPEVPFDNNQAERDIRMVKLKQKISGCFRSMKGANMFCRIRSYISTVRKQKKNVWESMLAAIKGNPVDFSYPY